MISAAAVDVFSIVKTSVEIELSVRHHMCLAVRHMPVRRKNGIAPVCVQLHILLLYSTMILALAIFLTWVKVSSFFPLLVDRTRTEAKWVPGSV